MPHRCQRSNVNGQLLGADHVHPFRTTVYPSSAGCFQYDKYSDVLHCHQITVHQGKFGMLKKKAQFSSYHSLSSVAPQASFILFHFFKHHPACWHSKMRCCAKHIGFPNRSTIHSLWAPLVNLFYFIYLRPVGSGRNGNPPTLASGILNDSW